MDHSQPPAVVSNSGSDLDSTTAVGDGLKDSSAPGSHTAVPDLCKDSAAEDTHSCDSSSQRKDDDTSIPSKIAQPSEELEVEGRDQPLPCDVVDGLNGELVEEGFFDNANQHNLSGDSGEKMEKSSDVAGSAADIKGETDEADAKTDIADADENGNNDGNEKDADVQNTNDDLDVQSENNDTSNVKSDIGDGAGVKSETVVVCHDKSEYSDSVDVESEISYTADVRSETIDVADGKSVTSDAIDDKNADIDTAVFKGETIDAADNTETIDAADVKSENIDAADVKSETIDAADVKSETIDAADVKSETIESADVKSETIDAADVKSETIAVHVKCETIDAADVKSETTADDVKSETIDAADIEYENIDAAEAKIENSGGLDVESDDIDTETKNEKLGKDSDSVENIHLVSAVENERQIQSEELQTSRTTEEVPHEACLTQAEDVDASLTPKDNVEACTSDVPDAGPQDRPSELSSYAGESQTETLSTQLSPCEQNDPSLNHAPTSDTVIEETKLIGSEEDTHDNSPSEMDEQGETHGGAVRTSTGSKLVDQFFGISPPSKPSKPVTANGDAVACTLRIDEPGDDVMGKDYASSRCRMDKESSPEIIVDCLDSVENVTLKDATSEKELLGNGDTALVCGQTDSLGSRSHEDKRKSSSDIDMDFAVLELDSSHLNLDASKQKTSLRKKGSLARRKKPSRGNVTQLASGSPESMFQDCTDSKPVVSPTSDATEDDVFDKHLAAGSEQPSRTSSSVETIGVRKSAMPFKPSLIMPGLHDLSKSKLFNQERKKSGESPSSPTKSPLSPPPTVLPKPTTKGQKESQNKTIAAENCLLDNGSLGSGNMVSAGVVEELVITGDKDSALSSSELGKPARSDSESLSGPKFGRTDSWSSVSSPRRLSRGDSVSSMEGGEGGSTSTTPRRASIQGSAYGPIGFRPRRSSSIILDSNNKLVDNPALFSASQSPSTVTLTENSEVSVSAGLKSPLYKAPVWLSEMKAKTGAPPVGDSSPRLRSTSTESNESNPVAVSPPQSKNGLEGTGSEEGSSAEGASQKADPHASQKADPQDEERANWLKAAQERTARMAEQQNAKTEENGEEEEEDKQPPPPWAAELKKKSRPMVHPRLSSSFRDNNSKVAPFRKSSSFDRENGPVVSSDRDEYSPSWMKSSQIGKKAPIPLPKTSAKPSVNNDTNATSGSSENRMKAYETPRWKLELAEKKKKREAEMMPVVESSGEYEGSAAQNTTDSNAAPSVPQWKQQLSLRKKRSSVSDIVKEMDAAEAQEEKSGVDLAKQAEERRARLMRLGLLDQAQVGEES